MAELLEGKNGHRIWPKVTLVTAVHNGQKYLEDTIRSILNQRYPNLEYIIVDDGSTDGTADIIRSYERHLASWFSQPNRGLYAALNAGFARCTGEIMGWLNASDMLQNNGLFVVGSVFASFPEVKWITGRPTKFSSSGMTVEIREVPRWSRYRFLAGANHYIQQESTFWRKSLWEAAGAHLDESYRAEGDFELWVRFFRHAQLYSVDALIGGYRVHEDALSSSNMDRYNQNCDEIAAREIATLAGHSALKAFRRINRAVQPIPKVRGLWYRLAIKSLYRRRGPDWPPVIVDDGTGWVLRR